MMITQNEFSIDPLTVSPNLCFKKCMGSSKENLGFDFTFVLPQHAARA